jgi:hypothetical protein
MAEMEFDKDHTNWLHGDDSPSKEDLDQIGEESEEDQ